MVYRAPAAALLAYLSTQVIAADIPSCNTNQLCPESTPCCSAYGQCGVGAYCLAGCDPRSSFDLNSCVARPTCKSGKYQFGNLDDIQANTKYLGNDSTINWISEGTPAEYSADQSLLLTMAQDTVGTLLTSTFEVWYGKISATMKTSAGQGVVTAFIMMSDVKDEIDFEFVGVDLQHAQSNYYWQGDPIYTNEKNLTAANTNTEFHTYTIDWSPTSITWSVDGAAMRTLLASDTVNSTTGVQDFPQTPSRIMISLWPAGLSSNAPGTIEWSGGLIDWQSHYMQNGYYYAELKEVDVECYPAPSSSKESTGASYMYTSKEGLQSDVQITDDETYIASFYATGDNEQYDPNASNSAGTSKPTASGSSGSAAPVPSNAQTVPGDVGTGQRGGDGSSDSSGNSGSGSNGGSGASPSSKPSGGDSFNQNNMATGGKTEKAMQGSAIAVIIALVALVMI